MAYLGNKPATGENNAFRILDDISSHVVSFNGSSASVVSLANDTITITDDKHRYVTGQRITYGKGSGGTVITGLTDATAYYVIRDSATTIKLATTSSNASNGVAINLTGLGGGTAHTITLAFDGINTKFKATYENGTQDPLITRAAQLVLSLNGVIQQPVDSTTPSTGFGIDHTGTIIFSTAPASTDNFWGHVLASNTVTFDISDNTIDNFTGNGSLVNFTLSKIPPDNRNILVTLDGVVQYPSDNSTTRAYTLSENELQFVSAPASGVDIQVRHIGFAGASGGGGGVTGFYGRTGNVVLKNTDNIVANNATFSGNVSIAKTLTYMDVTNIDAVGIVTFQDDVQYNGSGAGISSAFWDKSANEFKFKDNVKLSFGDSQDLSLYHDGSDSRITNGGGLTYILGDVIRFRNHGDSGTVLNAALAGVDLYASTAVKLSTNASGVNITGILTAVSDGSAGVVLHRTFSGNVSGATNTPQLDFTLTDTATTKQVVAKISPQALAGTGNAFKGNLRFFTANDAGTSTERIRIASDGKLAIGNASPQQLLHVWPDTANTTSAYVRVTAGDRNSNTGIDIGQDASGDGQVNVVSNGTLTLSTNNTPRIKIANNSAATAIGTNAAYNAMLTVRGDLSGALLMLKATEDTNRFLVSGTDTNGCEVNLYDGAGGQKGILGVSGSEFFIKAPNNSAPIGFYTHNGSSVGLRLKLDSSGSLLFNQTQNKILVNTSDGSDNGWLNINGGGDASQTRGAGMAFYGNENSGSEGKLWLLAGDSGSTNGEIVMRTAGVDRLWISSTGLITHKFTSNNSTTAEGLYINNKQNTTGNNASLIFSNDSGERKKAAISYIDTGDYGSGDLVFALDGTDSGSLHLTNDEKLRIKLDGRLLVGTSITTQAHGNFDDLILKASNAGNAGITIVTSTTTQGTIAFSDGTSGTDQYRGFVQYSHNGDMLGLGAGGNDRLQIASDGTVTLKNNSGMMLDLVSSAGTGSAWIEFSDTDGTRKGYFGYGSSSSEKAYWVQQKAADMSIYSNGADRVIVHSNGKVTIGDGNETATAYGAHLLVDGGSGSQLTLVGSTSGYGKISFADGSGSAAAKHAGFIYMDHTSTDNGPRLTMGQSDVTMLHLRSPGSQRGQLELYGNFNEESTPALEINDGGDARKAYMSNTSGDLVLWTRNASRIGGKLKIFEHGTLRYDKADPSNSANLHKCFQTSNYKVNSGSTNQSTTYTTQYIIAGGWGGDEGMYHGRTNFQVNAASNDHYQPVAFVPMGYHLDDTSFGGHWFGDVWINQSGSQKPSDFGGTNTNWSTMTAQIKWDCAHWNAKPQLSSVVHYVNHGQASIGRLFFSGTQCMWIGWFQPGYYAVQYRVNRGISVHTATSAGGSILVRHSNSWFTANTMAYSSRNTNFDSAIMYGGNGSHST